jgi:hypothetical protein
MPVREAGRELEDYKEGVWTPVILSNDSPHITYTPPSGIYQKIGTPITVDCYITWTE